MHSGVASTAEFCHKIRYDVGMTGMRGRERGRLGGRANLGLPDRGRLLSGSCTLFHNTTTQATVHKLNYDRSRTTKKDARELTVVYNPKLASVRAER